MVDSIQGFGSMQSLGMQAQRSLSSEQKTLVQDILSDYDPNNISKSDAESIFKAFKQAGIQPGAGLKEAIEESGFDAEKLRSLAPRPSQGGPGKAGGPGGAGKPGGPGGAGKSSGVEEKTSTTSLNAATLQTLQDILDEYDLTELSSEDENSLLSKLTDAGLMRTGITIDLSA